MGWTKHHVFIPHPHLGVSLSRPEQGFKSAPVYEVMAQPAKSDWAMLGNLTSIYIYKRELLSLSDVNAFAHR